MHQMGYAHCDLKPGNFLLDLTQSGTLIPILTDFGISHVLDPVQMHVKAFVLSPIQGASLPYAAPEVFRSIRGEFEMKGDGLIRADTYAIAAIIHEMVKRQVPWGKKKK